MRPFFLILAAHLFLPREANAALLTGERTGPKIEDVSTSPAAELHLGTKVMPVKLVGAGLRYKKVAFLKVKVYVGEFFLDAPEKFQRQEDKALGSLAEEKTMAFRLTFLRGVDGEKISGGFREALETNGVKLDAPAIQDFLAAVKAGGKVQEKETLAVAGTRLPDGREELTYENAAGKAVSMAGNAGLLRDVFSMWLGKTDDSGVESLKKSILEAHP